MRISHSIKSYPVTLSSPEKRKTTEKEIIPFPGKTGDSIPMGLRCAITMASRQGEDHGSRFMILIGGDAFLDSKYTAFAKIIQGQEVLGKIRENSKAKIEILRIGAEAEAFQPDRNSVAALIEDAREKKPGGVRPQIPGCRRNTVLSRRRGTKE